MAIPVQCRFPTFHRPFWHSRSAGVGECAECSRWAPLVEQARTEGAADAEDRLQSRLADAIDLLSRPVPAPVVNMPAPVVNMPSRRTTQKVVERDEHGRITQIVEVSA